MHPAVLKFLLNVYPPYLGTGIVVERIDPDYRQIVVRMKMRWYNRNYVNTHFGGSLYAMTDPFYMLMLMHILGDGYVVWDKAAHIDFVRPGRGTLKTRFVITEDRIREIVAHTGGGEKYLPEFVVTVRNEADEPVASVTKILYVRKK